MTGHLCSVDERLLKKPGMLLYRAESTGCGEGSRLRMRRAGRASGVIQLGPALPLKFLKRGATLLPVRMWEMDYKRRVKGSIAPVGEELGVKHPDLLQIPVLTSKAVRARCVTGEAVVQTV